MRIKNQRPELKADEAGAVQDGGNLHHAISEASSEAG